MKLLSQAAAVLLGHVDVVMAPVNGVYTMSPQDMAPVLDQLHPSGAADALVHAGRGGAVCGGAVRGAVQRLADVVGFAGDAAGEGDGGGDDAVNQSAH
ncbi:MAG: MBL fold metallo-hydrolase [Acetobacteraceae bacterium]